MSVISNSRLRTFLANIFIHKPTENARQVILSQIYRQSTAYSLEWTGSLPTSSPHQRSTAVLLPTKYLLFPGCNVLDLLPAPDYRLLCRNKAISRIMRNNVRSPCCNRKTFVVGSFSISSLQRNRKRERCSCLVSKTAFVREHCDIISGITTLMVWLLR